MCDVHIYFIWIRNLRSDYKITLGGIYLYLLKSTHVLRLLIFDVEITFGLTTVF